MSRVEVLLAVLASPERARSLFTVRAAISSARLVLPPRCFALALMCSYYRSRLGLDPLGTAATSSYRHSRSRVLAPLPCALRSMPPCSRALVQPLPRGTKAAKSLR
jgi:hypothetical protein